MKDPELPHGPREATINRHLAPDHPLNTMHTPRRPTKGRNLTSRTQRGAPTPHHHHHHHHHHRHSRHSHHHHHHGAEASQDPASHENRTSQDEDKVNYQVFFNRILQRVRKPVKYVCLWVVQCVHCIIMGPFRYQNPFSHLEYTVGEDAQHYQHVLDEAFRAHAVNYLRQVLHAFCVCMCAGRSGGWTTHIADWQTPGRVSKNLERIVASGALREAFDELPKSKSGEVNADSFAKKVQVRATWRRASWHCKLNSCVLMLFYRNCLMEQSRKRRSRP